MLTGKSRIYRAFSTEAKDQEIARRIKRALRESLYPPLAKIEVHFHHGRLTLQGRVATYYLKQLAQTLALAEESVKDVDNDIKVTSK